MLESVFKTAIKSTDPKLLNAIAQRVANERGNPNSAKESPSELRFNIFTAQKPVETSFGILSEGVARADDQEAWLEATSTLAGDPSQRLLNTNYYNDIFGANSKSKKDFDLDDLENLFGELSNSINPAFIEEFNRLGGSSGVGFSAGSTNTEKSFNPLTEITTLKNGLVVSSLNSFFKVADIKNPEMKKFAEGLLKNDQWGAYSRAFDDLFIHALKNDGLDPKKDKEEMSSKISTYIAQTAKLLNDSINNSGKEISNQNRALASSFIATHFSVDGVAENLGFDADTIKKYQEGDKHFLLSEALMENPKILQDPEKMNLLKDHLSSLIKDNYDSKLSQYSKDYNGNELKTIESGMIGLLTGKYKDIVAKLNGGQTPSEAQIKAFMSQAGFKANSKDYFKIGNSEIAAQTYLNLKAIEHDHALLKQGKLTDENRMFNSAQTNLRLTPTAAADHNGAFNELNSGRNSMAVAGMNRDQVANIAVPFVNKDQVGGILDKMKDLDIKLSSVDISLHGYQQGTSEFSIADKEGLLKNLAERMADGGEILYNSCLTGRGTEEGANNLALNTLMTAAKDKGLKVHAADNETIGYQEDTVYDAFSRLIANTPRKLDGRVGGYTIQEGGKEEILNRNNTSEKQIVEYIASKKEQGS